MRSLLFSLERCNWVRIALVALIAALAINNVLWLRVSTLPPIWDEADHFLDSLDAADYIASGPLGWVYIVRDVGLVYPPLVAGVVAPFYFLFGRTVDVGVAALGTILLGPLVLAVYRIGAILHSRKAGLLAAVLISTYPMVQGHSRAFMLELPVAAIAALSVWALLATDQFRDPLRTVLWGLSLGAGLLTKWTFPAFVIGPVVAFTLASRVWRPSVHSPGGRQGVKWATPRVNWLLGLVMGALVAFLWYLPRVSCLATVLFGDKLVAGSWEGDPWLLSWRGITYYLLNLVNNQIYLPLFVLFLLSLGGLRKSTPAGVVLFSWLLITYVIATLIRNYQPDYTLGLLVPVALITAIGLWGLPTRAGAIARVLAVVIALVQAYAVSWGFPSLPAETRLPVPLLGEVTVWWQNYSSGTWEPGSRAYSRFHPIVEDWQTDEMLASILADNGSRQASVVVVPDDPRIWQALRCEARVQNAPLSVITGCYEPEQVASADYIITKMGGWMGSPLLNRVARSEAAFKRARGHFEVLTELELPDGSTCLIYRRSPER